MGCETARVGQGAIVTDNDLGSRWDAFAIWANKAYNNPKFNEWELDY